MHRRTNSLAATSSARPSSPRFAAQASANDAMPPPPPPPTLARAHPTPAPVMTRAQNDGLLSPVSATSITGKGSPRPLRRQMSENDLGALGLGIGSASLRENVVKYSVRTSDAIERPRVEVWSEDGGFKVWEKERELLPHVIESTLTDVTHPQISYTLTRPLTHFALSIASPLFPRASSIPLRIEPLPSADGGGVEIEVMIACRLTPAKQVPSPQASSPSAATYPPSSHFSTQSTNASSIASSSSTILATAETRVLQFTILPARHPLFHLPAGAHNHHLSSTGRRNFGETERVPLSPGPRSRDAFRKDGGPADSLPGLGLGGRPVAGWSGSLSRTFGGVSRTLLSWAGHKGPGEPARPSLGGKSFHILPPPDLFPALPPPSTSPRPLLTFRDETPWFWSSGTTQGTLLVDEEVVRVLGVEKGFWIALALAGLEVEEEREGYLAAQDG